MWLCGLCKAHAVNRYYLTHSQAIPKSHFQEEVGGLKGIRGWTSDFLSGRHRRREQVSPGDPIAWGVRDCYGHILPQQRQQSWASTLG